jgi:hypothetical protein
MDVVLSFNFCLEFSFFINNKRIDVSIHYIYIDIEYFSTISYGVSVLISNEINNYKLSRYCLKVANKNTTQR